MCQSPPVCAPWPLLPPLPLCAAALAHGETDSWGVPGCACACWRALAWRVHLDLYASPTSLPVSPVSDAAGCACLGPRRRHAHAWTALAMGYPTHRVSMSCATCAMGGKGWKLEGTMLITCDFGPFLVQRPSPKMCPAAWRVAASHWRTRIAVGIGRARPKAFWPRHASWEAHPLDESGTHMHV